MDQVHWGRVSHVSTRQATKLSDPNAGIHLSGCDTLVDSDLKRLANVSVKFLDLSRTSIDGTGLRFLEGKTINRMDLSYTRLSDEGMRCLKKIEISTSLLMNRTDISNQGLIGLKCPSYLEIGTTGITDTGIEGLLRTERLQRLDARNTMIGDPSLEFLAKKSPLSENIILLNTKVTLEGKRAFAKAKPSCTVYDENRILA